MEMLKGSFSLEVMDPDNISGWKDEDPYFGSESVVRTSFYTTGSL